MIQKKNMFSLTMLFVIVSLGCIGQFEEGTFIELNNLIDSPQKYYLPSNLQEREKINYFWRTEGYILKLEETAEVIGYTRASLCEIYNNTDWVGITLFALLGLNDNWNPYDLYWFDGTLHEFYEYDEETIPIFIVHRMGIVEN